MVEIEGGQLRRECRQQRGERKCKRTRNLGSVKREKEGMEGCSYTVVYCRAAS